ncbi:hypothetical protein KCU91_g1385, partial [Aureobasidium melanogenum]
MAGRYTTVLPDQLVINEATVGQNNAHMTRLDLNFCVWIMKQLKTVGHWHMVEPFLRLPNQSVGIQTINQRLHNGSYPNAATLQEELLSIPTDWLERNAGQTHRHVKANDLMLELPRLFKARNRVDNAHRRSQQQQPPTIPSASASTSVAPAVADNAASDVSQSSAQTPTQDPAQEPVQEPAPGPTHDAAQHATTAVPATAAAAAVPPPAVSQTLARTTRELSIRTTTPGPSREPNDHPGASEDHASNTEPFEHSFGEDVANAFRYNSAETPEPSSALRQARSEKRRASGEDIGTSSKRARQETPKHKYRNLRVEIAEVFDREMELVHSGRSTIELEEGAQRYVDHLSRMDAGAMQKATRADLNEIKEDYVGELEEVLVELAQRRINGILARKGQSIQPRMSLSSKMEDEEDNNEAGVKRE